MKVLCFFLLMAGFVVCEGQGLDGHRVGEGLRVIGGLRVDGGSRVIGGREGELPRVDRVGLRPGVGGWVQRVGFDSVRVMKPDRMGCLVPGMGRVERMPVKRMYNGDRMVVRKGGTKCGREVTK